MLAALRAKEVRGDREAVVDLGLRVLAGDRVREEVAATCEFRLGCNAAATTRSRRTGHEMIVCRVRLLAPSIARISSMRRPASVGMFWGDADAHICESKESATERSKNNNKKTKKDTKTKWDDAGSGRVGRRHVLSRICRIKREECAWQHRHNKHMLRMSGAWPFRELV